MNPKTNIQPSGAMPREPRIDIVRGIAIITILLNHFAMAYRAVGFSGTAILTPTQLGYSSAASIFVALSGYMVGLVYMKRQAPIQAVIKRAFELYLVNLAVFVTVAPAALIVDPAKDRFWYMQRLLHDPLDGTVRFLTLRDAPAFLDVLQLYIALLLMTPIAILLARRARWLLIACSLALWALIQLWPFVMPSHLPTPIIGRTLNALAWQMAFFLPMVAGMARLHEPIFSFFRRVPLTVVVIVALLVAFGIAHEIDLRLTEPRVHMALTNRPVHGPVWTVHALLLLMGYLGLLTLLTPWLRALPFRLLASLGRNSLLIYATSIPIIFASALAIGGIRTDQPGYLLGILIVVILALTIATWSDARKRRATSVKDRAAAQPA